LGHGRGRTLRGKLGGESEASLRLQLEAPLRNCRLCTPPVLRELCLLLRSRQLARRVAHILGLRQRRGLQIVILHTTLCLRQSCMSFGLCSS
jgi:hypothetical protein